jgi:hypothetical protein
MSAGWTPEAACMLATVVRKRHSRLLAGTTFALLGACLALALAAQPVELAAPYEYLGWGNPQTPSSVLAATHVKSLTLAFVLSHGVCGPAWDGSRPLSGGSDAAAIQSIRAAGGDVDVSFGGWSGKKLGNSCKAPATLAGAYQKVIEHGEFTSRTVRKRVVAALALVQKANPGLEISITFGLGEGGPEAAGLSLIADAAAIGFQPTVWTGMPFDFGHPLTDMGHASIRAAEGLAQALLNAYGLSAAAAYAHTGVSSMNGQTDEASETVTLEDMNTMLTFAQQERLGRLTFWSVNRDRACGGANMGSDSCSGIAQPAYAFSDVIAQYHG